ncbi:hypothetical protein GQ600_6219 [Phytophthora cactorum]|nr:hypothetical protein GQ600_6219 [Phytophthora cactorum]
MFADKLCLCNWRSRLLQEKESINVMLSTVPCSLSQWASETEQTYSRISCSSVSPRTNISDGRSAQVYYSQMVDSVHK